MVTPKKIIMNSLELADEEIARLRKENKELKENLEEVAKELIQHHEEYKNMADMVVELGKENKELRKENKNLLYEIKCGYENRKERDKRMLELEEENKELKEKLDKLRTDNIYEEGLYE